jgi:acyl-CoA thioesterase-2
VGHNVRVTSALDDLVATLDLEAVEVDIYRGVSPAGDGLRVFGGQVAGQALVAAGRTVQQEDRRSVHSLQAYFLRPGDPTIPIIYEVDRIRDGRSFTTRRVAAIQRGEAIFHLSASFHVPEEGVAHQTPMPAVADPETLPDWRERNSGRLGAWHDRPKPIDVRYIGDPVRDMPSTPPRAPEHAMWFRADGKLPDDPMLHACIVAYASDLTLLDTIMLPHGLIWDDPDAQQVSLDHAMWFHRPLRADDWLLYTQRSPIAAGGRGLAVGTIFTRTGDLAVTVVQEGLLRTHRPTRAGDPTSGR